MALFSVGKRWEKVELIELGALKIAAVCSGLAHYELKGLHRTSFAPLVVVTALKVIVFAVMLHAFIGGIPGGGPLRLAMGLIPVAIIGGYVIFGFYPLMFGEFVSGGAKILPLSTEESELLNRFALNGVDTQKVGEPDGLKRRDNSGSTHRRNGEGQ